MKKIDWSKWSAIAEILSAIAIVITLLYLAVQTRYLAVQTEQNNDLLTAQARLTMLENRSEFSLLAIESPEFADLIARNMAGDDLSASDEIRINQIMIRVMVNWEYEFREYAEGRLEERDLPIEAWRNWVHGRGSLSLPPFDDEWDRLKGVLDDSFIEFMEQSVIQPSAPE